MKRTALIAALAVATCVSCQGGHHDSHRALWEDRPPVPVEIPAADRWTRDVVSLPVEGEEAAGFRVVVRTPELVQYPCGQCHDEKLPPRTTELPERAHWTITRPHGEAAGLSCATCHEREEPERLRGPQGQSADLDHAYRVCASCHFQQHDDWVGGAHGKRLGSWAGERIVHSCSACHDPHEPALPHRLPSTYAPPPREARR